ncbi:hypothetical protein NOCA1200018 [metagenome]|uniref:Uncharacterized protein n=1 Tax=metagenome TaxID=256318 RepID=A0A2P2CE37_9ZZZZ
MHRLRHDLELRAAVDIRFEIAPSTTGRDRDTRHRIRTRPGRAQRQECPHRHAVLATPDRPIVVEVRTPSLARRASSPSEDRKMMAPVLRGMASTLTVLLAIAVTYEWGDNAGKVAAAVIGAALIVLIEWFVQWSPKHLQWARALLDPRAKWTGIWMQSVKTVTDTAGRHPDDPNACSVFRIDYKNGAGYWVQGNAYDRNGSEVAYYKSEGHPTFTKDGRTMSYVWTGDSIAGDSGPIKTTREGLARMTFDEGETDFGTGRVQHVGMDRELTVTFERVTDGFLRRHGLEDYTPAGLRSAQTRQEFARKVSRSSGPPNAAEAHFSEGN